MQATTALFESAGVLTQDNVREVILRTNAGGESPIYTALLAAGRQRTTTRGEVTWYDRELTGRRTQINNGGSAYGAATTEIVVDNGAIFRAGDILLAEATGEVMYVQGVSTNTLTVTRGMGSTSGAIASVADNAFLQQIGAASGEGADAPPAGATAPQRYNNYLQTFRETVELSGRLASEDAEFGETPAEQRQWKFQELMRDIESSIIHGRASNSEVDANNRRVFTMDGLLSAITTNVDNVGGGLSKARFHQSCEQSFQYGNSDKVLFASPTLMTALHTLYETGVRTVPDQPPGLVMQEILIPYGRLRIVPHRGLVGSFDGYGIIADPSNARVTFKAGERGQPHLKPHDVGKQDAVSEEWMAELCIEWGSEATHAVIQGVTGAA